MCTFHQLTEINLSSNNLTNLQILINSLLKKAPSLKTLKLLDMNFKDETFFSCELLPKTLEYLDISQNKCLNNLNFINVIF